MPISDVFSQVKNNYAGTKSDVSSGLRKAIQDSENNFINKSSNVANAGLTTGVGNLLSAASQAFSGNTSGAAATLADITGSIGNSTLKALNLGGNGNSNTSASYSNGISPGNSLSGASARLDPLLSFSWYAELPVLSPVQPSAQAGGSTLTNKLFNAFGGGVLGGVATSLVNDLANLSASSVNSYLNTNNSSPTQCPWYYIEEANCPFRSFSTVSAFREGRKRIYPSEYTVADLVLTMYMDNSNISLAYLKTWENLVLNPITKSTASEAGGRFGLPSGYKKSIFIYLLSASKQQIMIIEYAECFPTNVHNLSLDSANSNRLLANVNFSVGDVYTTIMPVGESGISGVLSGALSIKGAASNIVNSAIGGAVNSLVNLL